MAAEYASTDAFRGATFRECDFSGARIIGGDISDLQVSGFTTTGRGVVVDGVDTTAFVRAELDRRHPERVRLREAHTAEDLRSVWDTVEQRWAETLTRAERLPESLRQERVDDEWSLLETLRHLVFAIDVWMGRMVLGEEQPFHRAGLPFTGYPEAGAAELGIDLDARPSYGEAVAVHAERRRQVGVYLGAVTDADLDEVRTAVPAPAWGEESQPVRECLRVLIDEHVEHRRYAERDLAALETRSTE